MSRPVQVRPVREDELVRVGELTVAAYLEDRLLDPSHAYVDELRDAAGRARAATVLVALDPAVPGPAGVLGTVTLAEAGSGYAELARGAEVELRMLAVDAPARRRGVAEALVRAALREAVLGGHRVVVLSTLVTMRTAHRLYARLGFVRAADRDWGDEVDLQVHVWHAPEAPGVLAEAATWPPLGVVDVHGWRAGLSHGVTRRASSVVPLGSPDDLSAAVDEVERVYRADGAPAVFRTGDPGEADGLVDELDRRGYVVASLTEVLVRTLGPDPSGRGAPRAAAGLRVLTEPDDAWLAAWLGGKGGDPGVSRAVVTGAPATYLAVPGPDGTDLGVIRAARTGDWVALSCLQVSPQARRRGLGRTLTDAALALAAADGAGRAFLQVEVHNAPAVRLYEAAGFVLAHRYAYRVQPTGCTPSDGC